MEDELNASTPAHYSFCGPSSLSEFAPPTVVLHLKGKPDKKVIERRLDELGAYIEQIPGQVAEAVAQANGDGNTEPQSPEEITNKAFLSISKALSMAKRIRDDELSRSSDDLSTTPSGKKLKLNSKKLNSKKIHS